MATIDERLADMYARQKTVRLPRRRPVAVRPPALKRGMPPMARVSPQQLAQINRAHNAAMRMIHKGGKGGGCPDGELLLSFVVWPTPAIIEALESAAAAA